MNTHPLDAFLSSRNLTIKQFCGQAGISQMTYWRLRNGASEFSTKLLRKISDATGGEVTPAQLIEAIPRSGEPVSA